jgi:NAD(P)-dependent dehydrogenase (short-subunit alcohol dehydrogenase family)
MPLCPPESLLDVLAGGLHRDDSAKGAIVQLTKSRAIELAPHNIQVNAIAPGWIETDMTAPVRTMPLNDEILARTPAGRWGQPEEVAGTAVYLASRASDFVTGTTFASMAAMRSDNIPNVTQAEPDLEFRSWKLLAG